MIAKDYLIVSYDNMRISLNQVISGQLVSFRSIAELQQQNQKLLCVVRELSEDQERREMEDEDPKVRLNT